MTAARYKPVSEDSHSGSRSGSKSGSRSGSESHSGSGSRSGPRSDPKSNYVPQRRPSPYQQCRSKCTFYDVGCSWRCYYLYSYNRGPRFNVLKKVNIGDEESTASSRSKSRSRSRSGSHSRSNSGFRYRAGSSSGSRSGSHSGSRSGSAGRPHGKNYYPYYKYY